MIRLTRLNQVPLVVNADLIEHIETTPDTVVSLTTGQKFMVRETPSELVKLVVDYKRSILLGTSYAADPPRCKACTSYSELPLQVAGDGK